MIKKERWHMSYASLRRTIYTLRRRAFPIIRYGDFLKIITSLQQEYNSKSEYWVYSIGWLVSDLMRKGWLLQSHSETYKVTKTESIHNHTLMHEYILIHECVCVCVCLDQMANFSVILFAGSTPDTKCLRSLSSSSCDSIISFNSNTIYTRVYKFKKES